MNYKYHYVYRITNKVTQMYYYGDRSCNCQPSEDIGIKYFSTSTLKLFIKDQKVNPQDYKYKVVKIFETCREDAKQLEVDLHKKFDVKNHNKFINRANQTSSGFDTTGITPTREYNITLSQINKRKATMAEKTIDEKLAIKKKQHDSRLKALAAETAEFKENKKNSLRKTLNNRTLVEKEVYSQLMSDSYVYSKERIRKQRKSMRVKSEQEINNIKSKHIKTKYSKRYFEIYKGDILLYTIQGNLKEFCKIHDINFLFMEYSYLHDGTPKIFNHCDKPNITKAIKSGNIRFEGWKCIRIKV